LDGEDDEHASDRTEPLGSTLEFRSQEGRRHSTDPVPDLKRAVDYVLVTGARDPNGFEDAR
jgi:hypothetical protein